MKINAKQVIVLTFLTSLAALYMNCGQTGFNQNFATAYKFNAVTGVVGGNTIALTVGGACGATNRACVQAQVCDATSTCVTLSKLLLDTHSTGLRIFKNKISTLNLTQITDTNTGNNIANCEIRSGSIYHWGPVQKATVQLGNETPVDMPIQVIDYTFGDTGILCRSLSNGVAIEDTATYDGILGINFFKQDCGSNCVSFTGTNNLSYLSCSGVTCGFNKVPLVNQVQNPIAALNGDNNGFVIEMNSVASTGAVSTSGILTFGVGTQPNNRPVIGSVTRIAASSTGTFQIINGDFLQAFIDSSSEANRFAYGSMTACSTNVSYFCPASSLVIPVSIVSANGLNQIDSFINVGNGDSLIAGGKKALNSLAGPIPASLSGYIQLGLPFFYGRKIYFGIEGRGTSLGDGPFIGL